MVDRNRSALSDFVDESELYYLFLCEYIIRLEMESITELGWAFVCLVSGMSKRTPFWNYHLTLLSNGTPVVTQKNNEK